MKVKRGSSHEDRGARNDNDGPSNAQTAVRDDDDAKEEKTIKESEDDD